MEFPIIQLLEHKKNEWMKKKNNCEDCQGSDSILQEYLKYAVF